MAAAWSRIAPISSSEKRTLKYFNKTFNKKSRPLQIPWLLFYFSVYVTVTTQLLQLKHASDAMFLFSLRVTPWPIVSRDTDNIHTLL